MNIFSEFLLVFRPACGWFSVAAIREAQRRAAAAGLASSQAAGTATLNMNSKMAPTAAKRKMLWGKAPAQTKQWDGVALEGDDSGERKNKFLKLMGGLKKGVASVDSPPAAQVAVEVAAEPCRQPVNNTAFVPFFPSSSVLFSGLFNGRTLLASLTARNFGCYYFLSVF